MKTIVALGILFVGLFVVACAQDDTANIGFSLPEGDAENGQIIFTEMRCIECHVLAGADFIGEQSPSAVNGEVLVVIGGEDGSQVNTYADLVTSIINPSHRIAEGYALDEVTVNGESKMLNYNDVLTVNELVDLVTFLTSQYELHSVPLTVYPYYGQ